MFMTLWFAIGLLIAARQVLAPETAPILEMVAWVLPVISRYVTEWVKKNRPELDEKVGSGTIARNVGVVLFLVFAGLGLAARPEFIIPDMPSTFVATDWLSWLLSLLAVGTILLHYTIRGSNDVHDRISGKTAPPELPPPGSGAPA